MAIAILGNLLKKGLSLRNSAVSEKINDTKLQLKELEQLLAKAQDTEFGRHYGFRAMVELFEQGKKKEAYRLFKEKVPLFDYNSMYEGWWKKALEGQADVAWPGSVKYFALSSGTSEASTKHIPITKDITKAIQKTSTKQIVTLDYYDIPARAFETGVLMLGGSTSLNYNGVFYEGDLSGIQAKNLPIWFSPFYKPGKKIAQNPDWGTKLEAIVEHADSWDIGAIVGVPAWLQLLLEKIIDHYGIAHIHEIWPNLSLFMHGGVAFDPYKKSFEKLLGKEIIYIETYLASEGFIAYQDRPGEKQMRLSTDTSLFFEFVPFEESNLDGDGNLRPDAQTMMIDEVEVGKEYALLLSSSAGAWRYQIGDTVRIVSTDPCKILITGRTKHFLSVVGEHLSVDNMNKAIELTADGLDVRVKEFTVHAEEHESLFAHHWYIGTEDPVDQDEFTKLLDENLKKLNDDYKTERAHALKDVRVTILENELFHSWLKAQGKEGGQIKFPRVLNGQKLKDWKAFLAEQNN